MGLTFLTKDYQNHHYRNQYGSANGDSSMTTTDDSKRWVPRTPGTPADVLAAQVLTALDAGEPERARTILEGFAIPAERMANPPSAKPFAPRRVPGENGDGRRYRT